MNYVEPIKDKEQIRDIADYLKKRNKRDYVLWIFGITTGLRIGDILKLKVRDITLPNSKKVQPYIYLKEEKTNKHNRIDFPKKIIKILEDYIEDKEEYEPLFKSREGKNKSISRFTVAKKLKKAGETLGILHVSCHSMRKTFGYNQYMATKDIGIVQELLNHSSPRITKRYIGIVQENLTDARLNQDLSYLD